MKAFPGDWATPGSLAAAAVAAIGASGCCAIPLLLATFGAGGAWAAGLAFLEPYQAYLMTAALLFFGVAFYRLYRTPEECGIGQACSSARIRTRQRAMFWGLAIGSLLLVTFPRYAAVFY